MKWKTSMKYQITESIKPLAIFYGILYGLVGITLVISRAVADVGGFSGMESSTMVFLLFCGVFSFVEDFRFFLQNGMTRRMIFQSECAQFFLISLFMMLVETGMGALLHWLAGYESMFHLIYGHSYFVGVEMLWRFVVYLMIVNTAFLFTLIQNRVGKVAFILGCLTIGLALVVLLPSINMALDGAIADAVFPFLAKLMGFDGGAVHMAYPILTFLAVTAAVSLASYLMLRRAELK